MINGYYVYIMADRARGRTYVGVTNDLLRRAYEHRNNIIEGHTKRYSIHHLVYFEHTTDIHSAISREKRIKAMSRVDKLALVETKNPTWKDLYKDLCGG